MPGRGRRPALGLRTWAWMPSRRAEHARQPHKPPRAWLRPGPVGATFLDLRRRQQPERADGPAHAVPAPAIPLLPPIRLPREQELRAVGKPRRAPSGVDAHINTSRPLGRLPPCGFRSGSAQGRPAALPPPGPRAGADRPARCRAPLAAGTKASAPRQPAPKTARQTRSKTTSGRRLPANRAWAPDAGHRARARARAADHGTDGHAVAETGPEARGTTRLERGASARGGN